MHFTSTTLAASLALASSATAYPGSNLHSSEAQHPHSLSDQSQAHQSSSHSTSPHESDGHARASNSHSFGTPRGNRILARDIDDMVDLLVARARTGKAAGSRTATAKKIGQGAGKAMDRLDQGANIVSAATGVAQLIKGRDLEGYETHLSARDLKDLEDYLVTRAATKAPKSAGSRTATAKRIGHGAGKAMDRLDQGANIVSAATDVAQLVKGRDLEDSDLSARDLEDLEDYLVARKVTKAGLKSAAGSARKIGGSAMDRLDQGANVVSAATDVAQIFRGRDLEDLEDYLVARKVTKAGLQSAAGSARKIGGSAMNRLDQGANVVSAATGVAQMFQGRDLGDDEEGLSFDVRDVAYGLDGGDLYVRDPEAWSESEAAWYGF